MLSNGSREITQNQYTGLTFENAAGGGVISASVAMQLWKNSAAHNAVILNRAPWNVAPYNPWPNFAPSVLGNYAVLTFGGTFVFAINPKTELTLHDDRQSHLLIPLLLLPQY